ncbi:hypothetical protein IAU60_000477 [Kwoniella sp. DSM 27419]
MASSFPSLTSAPRAFPLPTISEDTLHHVLHLPSSYDPAATALLITRHVQSLLLHPWLWNKDAWELKLASGEAGVGTSSTSLSDSKLEGRMRVGDAVDDEWLVVWLLREVSKKWPDIIIGVRDTDGEFLLIEAANELPPWVSPENADNRLWMYGGHLHLIPLAVRSATSSRPQQMPDDDELERQYDSEAYLSEADAIRAVRTDKYRAEPSVEQAVWNRISCYPDGLHTHQHRTKAYLPVPVAKVLAHNPELVQRAVEGFYVRDPAQLRAAARMSHFPPSSSTLTPVTLTRAAYAQLQGQIFHPPRVFGPEWHVREGAELDGERRWRDLGVKIATGFEIMYREGGKKGRGGTEAEQDGVRNDAAFVTFLENLKKAGWFENELEGSGKWKERETEAMKGYQGVKAADTASQRPSFAYLVDTALNATTDLDIDAIAASPSADEDSESWLEVSPDELDAMMIRASGRGPEKQSGGDKVELGEEHGQVLQNLAQKVEQFVGGQGDLAGARFVDELSDEDMDDSEDDEEDEADVRQSLEAEKQSRLQNLVPSVPANEWGKKTQDQELGSSVDEDAREAATKDKNDKKSKLDPIDSMKAKSRPPIFAKQEYDGVVYESESESESESELPPAGTLGRKIAQMKWSEGESKSATIEEIDDESTRVSAAEELQRRVWGDGDAEDDEAGEDDEGDEMEVDMGNEEEEFIKFSREALGITDEMWQGILGDRQARGASVSASKQAGTASDATSVSASAQTNKGSTAGKKVSFNPNAGVRASTQAAEAEAGTNPDVSLDSFENVMRAMDEQLARRKVPKKPTKGRRPVPPASSESIPSLPTEADLEALDDDELAAMDRELREALKGAGINDDDDDEMGIEEAAELDEEGRREYQMMKSFLESYRSQAGGSGVVGNLFGRLGGK